MGWIDMRKEMHIHINGGPGQVAQGYWIVLRIFRRDEKSPYWVEETDEAINGPEYYYDDHFVRTISYPAARYSKQEKSVGGIDSIASGFMENKDTYIFAIEYNVKFTRIPDEGDVIYHINKHASVNQPYPPITPTDRFKIVHSFNDFGDNGQIEMIYCVGVRTHGEG